MKVSRKHNPSTERDGIWFRHRACGGVYDDVEWDTTTRWMLRTPFVVDECVKPGQAPPGFLAKEAKNCMERHKFSEHENKDTVNCGMCNYECEVIRQRPPKVNKIFTDKDFLKHHSLNPVERSFNTSYGDSYLGTAPTEFPPIHRRFPKTYGEPAKGRVKLDTTTTDQFKCPGLPYTAKDHVIAKREKPRLISHPWKFSYNGVYSVPYDDSPKPEICSGLCRYGPATS